MISSYVCTCKYKFLLMVCKTSCSKFLLFLITSWFFLHVFWRFPQTENNEGHFQNITIGLGSALTSRNTFLWRHACISVRASGHAKKKYLRKRGVEFGLPRPLDVRLKSICISKFFFFLLNFFFLSTIVVIILWGLVSIFEYCIELEAFA